MKYKLIIEGGFMGIPQEYKGNISLNEEHKCIILKKISENNVAKPQNENMRDAFNYNLELWDADKKHEIILSERSIPFELRQLIDTIRSKAAPKRKPKN